MENESVLDTVISVIIPVYKSANSLRRCLDSVLAQSGCRFEVILIDDGSPDGSGAICDEYAARDERVRVIHKENGGVSSARNAGLDIAQGDYITFVDSDDYILPGMYESMLSLLDGSEENIAGCGYNWDYGGRLAPYIKEDVSLSLNPSKAARGLLTNRYYTGSTWAKLFPARCLSGLRFDEKLRHYEDYLFCYEAMKRAGGMLFNSRAYYCYCDNPDSAARAAFNPKMMGIIDVSEYMLSDILKEFPELRRDAMSFFMRNNLICAARMAREGYADKDARERVRENVVSNMPGYLFSGAAAGYKLNALLLTLGWRALEKRLR
jgi:glycosyltransferase involved in cell wall biosynthesis